MTLTNILRKNNFPSIFDDDYFKKDEDVFNPRANIIDHERNYSVEIEIPGVKKNQIEITFKNNVLKVKGEKKNELKIEKTNHYSFESLYGSFERSWIIRDVDENKIDAKFENGVLIITLPKKEEAISKDEEKKIYIK